MHDSGVSSGPGGSWLAQRFPPQSLRSYQDLGYTLLALPVGLALLVARSASFEMGDLAAGRPAWVALLLRLLFKQIPLLPADTALKLSLFELLAITYLVIWIFPRRRRALGGLYADGLSWLAIKAVQAAGWCIDNRWRSLLLMAALAASAGLSIRSWAVDHTAASVRSDHFAGWLGNVEKVLSTSAFDGSDSEIDKFRTVAGEWSPEFLPILSLRERKAALCLRDLVARLHQGYDPASSWMGHLVRQRKALVASYEAASEKTAAGEVAPLEAGRLGRIDALIHLLLAKTHVRLSLDDCSDRSMVLAANRYLEGAGTFYPDVVANLRGNVYNCLFDAQLQGNLGNDSGPVLELCASPDECLRKALEEYRKARGTQRCSFPWRRWLNNDLDAKLRLAARFDVPRTAATGAAPRERWLTDKGELAAEIERRAGELMGCNPTEPLIFVTAAQAFGAAAGMRPEGSDQQATDLRAAGVFLRIAHSYRPADLEHWNLAFFCSALNDGGYREDFLSGLSAPTGLLPLEPDYLRPRIRPCR